MHIPEVELPGQTDLVTGVLAVENRLADFESLAQNAFDAEALSDRSPVSFDPWLFEAEGCG